MSSPSASAGRDVSLPSDAVDDEDTIAAGHADIVRELLDGRTGR